MIEKIKALVAKLNLARKAYYVDDDPIMSDAEYDQEFAQLKELEETEGYIDPDSPTQNVGYKVMSKLKKITHEIPMRSLENVFSVREVYDFVQKHGDCVLSLKLDGLSGRMIYKRGILTCAATRGTGEEGEDITHNAEHIKNLPQKIHVNNIDKTELIVDGELISTWDNFNDYNDNRRKPNDVKFSHPRSFAAGSVRQLDSKIGAERGIKFVAWRVIKDDFNNHYSYDSSLKFAWDYGFDTVPRILIGKNDTEESIKVAIEVIRKEAEKFSYPYDGFVIAVDDLEYAKSLGMTSHHPQHSKALKEEQKPVKTILRNVEWAVGKTGLVAPTGVFDEIEIDGSKISRATLHNVSIMKELQIGIGDEVEVIKAAKIIPKIVANNTKSNTYQYPQICPCCKSTLAVRQEDKTYLQGLNDKTLDFDNGSVTLWCENPNCPEKNLSKFTQFVSKQGMNIDGLSENKLAALIKAGYITDFLSIYHLKDHPEIANLEGFGKKSYEKLVDAIEKSCTVKMNNVLVALCIPNVGKTVAKTLYKAFKGNFMEFIWACHGDYDFSVFDDIGKVINDSIYAWYKNPSKLDEKFIFAIQDDELLTFDTSEFNNVQTKDMISGDNDFCVGKNFVVTGKFNKYKRDEIGKMIEDRGGKLIGSVSKRTNLLLTNDGDSGSSKAEKAKELNIPIMSEEEFLKAIGLE